MGFIENFRNMGLRFTAKKQTAALKKREALAKIHAVLCEAETGEPVVIRQKFEKINVSQYTDEQVSRILKAIHEIHAKLN
jgi:hypothetical protein